MKCRYHPDREAYVVCQKMLIGYCADCLEGCEGCTDPDIYCKFRTQCIIWEMCRAGKKRQKEDNFLEQPKSCLSASKK